MEPLLLLAKAVTTYLIPKALEKIGERTGEAALAQGKKQIEAIQTAVRKKFEATRTEGALELARSQPTETHLAMVESILLNQMQADAQFAQKLEALHQALQAQSPTLQVALDNLQVEGNVTVGDITQENRDQSGSVQQVVGKDISVSGDLQIGNIRQHNTSIF